MTPTGRVSRRGFLRAAVGGGAALTLAGTGGFAYAREVEPWWFEVCEHDLALPGLPDAFAGLTIAHISDLHFGRWMSPENLAPALHAVQGLGADIIVVTGDLISRVTHGEPDMVVQALSQLSAREGVFVVLGNHDWWVGGSIIAESVGRSSATLLDNRHVMLRRGRQTLYMAGVDDVWVGRHDLATALDGVPSDGRVILLAHEPDFADIACRDRRILLQLSGHSHGGQVCVPGYGGLHFPPWARKYSRGLYRLGELTHYTNRGLGMVTLPLRFCCRPEITRFTLWPTA
jgi:predicted MPP superfamily phosphohydrolase